MRRYLEDNGQNVPWYVLLMVILGVSVIHAAAEEPAVTRPSAVRPVTQQKRLGAVQLRLDVDRQTLGIADRLKLTLSVDTPLDSVVTFPKVADQLGPFRVINQKPGDPQPIAPQRQRWQQRYTLEAESSGDLTLPSLTVSFHTSGTVEEQHLSTDPVTISVTSILPQNADPSVPRDIAPPVILVRHGLPDWAWEASVLLLGIVLLAGAWWWHHRRRIQTVAPPPQQPAHLVALQALQRLQHQNLIDQQRTEAFYVRLSDILRCYVEWRFGLRAPEQTTEEFLAVVLATGGLLARHRDLLEAFLAHCDLVKFARHQPTSDDMHHALESARVFVEQTADDNVVVDVSSSGVDAS